MNWKISLALLGFILGVASNAAADAALPSLAQLKLMAESGDRVAQYEYGQRAFNGTQVEQFAWLMKSAEQGYAPAQNAVAERLSGRYFSDPKKKRATERESVRWASRAAYQGIASAQSRISQAYASGSGISKDALKAYVWAQIAVNTTGGDRGELGGMVYRNNRDRLIAQTPSDLIAEGQKLAAAFKPMRFTSMNPIEADLVSSEMSLSAIYEIKDHKSAVVNGVRFASGETKTVAIDQRPIALTCIAIEGKTARFAITGTKYETELTLRR